MKQFGQLYETLFVTFSKNRIPLICMSCDVEPCTLYAFCVQL